MEKANVDTEVARLTRLERAWHDDQRRLRYLLGKAHQRVESTTAAADRLTKIAGRITDTRGDRFAMTIDGCRHTKRAKAGDHLRDLLSTRLAATPPETTTEPQDVGQLGGLDIAAQTTTVIENEIRILVPDTEIEFRYVEHEWRSGDPAQVIQRLERRIDRLPDTIEQLRNDAAEATEEGARAEAQLGEPWEHTDQLNRLRWRQQELNEALGGNDNPTTSSTRVPDLVEHALHDGLAVGGIAEPGSPEITNEVTRLRQHLDRPRPSTPDSSLSR